MKERLFDYILQLGDNSLILGHRLSEWCGHGPILEVDMALTNISLDLIGQTRNYFQYAAKIEDKGRTEDDLAFLRTDRQYRNYLLVEQPNGDFAATIARQFYFDSFHLLFLQELVKSKDEQLAAIAAKSVKEVSYHLRFSSDWLIRLGDGTEESRTKMQEGVDDLWNFTAEFFLMNDLEKEMAAAGIGVDVQALEESYYAQIQEVFEAAKIQMPDYKPGQIGGKDGMHSEHLGHLLAEMQYMQRAYPGMEW
ncbi:MAG: phenylacetate-CoA oxygenase subunit PaaC [Bacteroidia bacterium]|nr:phenylacetate-CoA oxygenase subunit PaaC [Bacteroidia bacterium]